MVGSLFLRMRKYDELVIKIYSARKREGKRGRRGGNHKPRLLYVRAPLRDAQQREVRPMRINGI